MKKLIKLFVVLFCFFTCINNVLAGTTTYNRTQSNNYGVNKKWKITSDNLDNIKSTPLVKSNEKIYDYSDILTDEEEEKIYKKINAFITETNMDMVFVSVDLPYSYTGTNENYAADFYDYNDFGIDFEKYSGILLLRNTYSLDRYYNVYLFGNAQLYYDYYRTEKVLDDIYYNFSHDYYYDGLNTFIDEMTSFYDEGIPSSMKNYIVDDNGFLKEKYSVPIGTILLIATIVTVITMIILIKKNKMVKKATKASEYINKESVQILKRSDILISDNTTSRIMSSSSSSGSSRSSSGSRSSSRGSSGGGHRSGGGRRG